MLPVLRAELERNPLSRPAAYWVIVAARGAGDLEGAWNAAVSGWVRAGSHAGGAPLRADIDAFVTKTLIPERAQERTSQRIDTKFAQAEILYLTEQWRTLSGQWK